MARGRGKPTRIPPQGETTVTRQEIQMRSGPLPDPEDLARFEAVQAGLADRITKLAEGHAKNYWRNDRAKRVTAIMGQIFAFLLAAGLIGSGVWLVYQGHSFVGMAMMGSVIVGIVTPFLKGSR